MSAYMPIAHGTARSLKRKADGTMANKTSTRPVQPFVPFPHALPLCVLYPSLMLTGPEPSSQDSAFYEEFSAELEARRVESARFQLNSSPPPVLGSNDDDEDAIYEETSDFEDEAMCDVIRSIEDHSLFPREEAMRVEGETRAHPARDRGQHATACVAETHSRKIHTAADGLRYCLNDAVRGVRSDSSRVSSPATSVQSAPRPLPSPPRFPSAKSFGLPSTDRCNPQLKSDLPN